MSWQLTLFFKRKICYVTAIFKVPLFHLLQNVMCNFSISFNLRIENVMALTIIWVLWVQEYPFKKEWNSFPNIMEKKKGNLLCGIFQLDSYFKDMRERMKSQRNREEFWNRQLNPTTLIKVECQTCPLGNKAVETAVQWQNHRRVYVGQ